MTDGIALIVDIVGSRTLEDRAGAQRAVLETLAAAARNEKVLRDPWATVGDEFQMILADLDAAVRTTGLTHLLLPDGLQVRFGLGSGSLSEIPGTGNGTSGTPIQDGSAWWAAREAIHQVHRLRESGQETALTWYAVGEGGNERGSERGSEGGRHGRGDREPEATAESLVNPLLLLRDHVVMRMKTRERRIAAALLQGTTQVDIARAEGISQSAVSQSAHRSGAATLVEVHRLLRTETAS